MEDQMAVNRRHQRCGVCNQHAVARRFSDAIDLRLGNVMLLIPKRGALMGVTPFPQVFGDAVNFDTTSAEVRF
jgi:hypothetical protein